MNDNRFPGAAQAQTQGGTASQGLSLEVVKVLRNTYSLLSMTLAFSAVMAGISTAMEMPFGVSLVCFLVSLGLIWFVLPKTATVPLVSGLFSPLPVCWVLVSGQP